MTAIAVAKKIASPIRYARVSGQQEYASIKKIRFERDGFLF